jgi:hypothetical protein
MVSLEDLLQKFNPYKNLEYGGRHFMTHVPTLGTLAYLNIIFDPSDLDIQLDIIDPLVLPNEIRLFYKVYNGAHLFSDLLSIYGFLPKVYKLERDDRRKTLPYNIIDINKEYIDDLLTSEIFIFGSYGFDRSELFIERATGRIYCSVGDDINKFRATWPSFETWLVEEIGRLSDCFDKNGNRLVEFEETLPVQN